MSDGTKGDWIAKWAGDLGDSLKVSLCGPTRANLASGNTVVASNSDITLTGGATFAVHASSKAITATSSLFGSELQVGDVIVCSGNTFIIATITSNTAGTVHCDPTTGAISSAAAVRLKRSPYGEPARNMVGTVAVTANVATVTATVATAGSHISFQFDIEFVAGDIITVNGEDRRVTAVTNSSLSLIHISAPTRR